MGTRTSSPCCRRLAGPFRSRACPAQPLRLLPMVDPSQPIFDTGWPYALARAPLLHWLSLGERICHRRLAPVIRHAFPLARKSRVPLAHIMTHPPEFIHSPDYIALLDKLVEGGWIPRSSATRTAISFSPGRSGDAVRQPHEGGSERPFPRSQRPALPARLLRNPRQRPSGRMTIMT